MLERVKGSSGFTFIEILMVMIMLGVLTQMAWNFSADVRQRSSDVSAVADGRNLITVVRANFINLDNVQFDHDPDDGQVIGTVDTGGNPRSPVFTLSPGVRARIELGSQSGVAEQGYYEAYLFHVNGTPDASPSGKREFWYLADQQNAIFSLPAY
jgi:prepilin-type N-terminal cleavage/methylation domain-containing protein